MPGEPFSDTSWKKKIWQAFGGESADPDVVGMTVGGRLVAVSAEFTRPANTTAYAAKDVVGTDPGAALEFASIARAAGGSGYITKVVVSTTDTGPSTASARFRLHLYNTSAPSGITDNSPNTVLYADRAKYLGYIDLLPATIEGAGSGAVAEVVDIAFPFVTSGNDDLWGVLETLDAITPSANSTTYAVRVTADQN